jgi:hypothetical protein
MSYSKDNSVTNKTSFRKLSMPKPKRWSHQSELDLNIGKEITLSFINRDGDITGVLIAADQFTIKIQQKYNVDKNSTQTTVFFKQAIENFEVKGV